MTGLLGQIYPNCWANESFSSSVRFQPLPNFTIEVNEVPRAEHSALEGYGHPSSTEPTTSVFAAPSHLPGRYFSLLLLWCCMFLVVVMPQYKLPFFTLFLKTSKPFFNSRAFQVPSYLLIRHVFLLNLSI